jgi:hypothetical protein
MTFGFWVYKLVVIILSIVVWIRLQYIGHGVGMASSGLEEGSPLDIYLGRVQGASGIAAISTMISFVTQLIPVRTVNMIGWFTIIISIICILVIITGVLRLRLPDTNINNHKDER